jgi:hypothetical protein
VEDLPIVSNPFPPATSAGSVVAAALAAALAAVLATAPAAPAASAASGSDLAPPASAPASPPAAAPSPPPEPGAPPVREHFPATGTPLHSFLVMDVATGDVVRVDDADAVNAEPVPLGTGRRFLAALTALEAGGLDPDATVACDSTCWARGAHGDVSVANALAWGCSTYFAHLDVDDRSVARTAAAVGLDAGGTTLRAWARFWRRAERSELHVRARTLTQLMAAAALSVSSPRGIARTLYDPRNATRAIVGRTDSGAWVTGVQSVPGGRRWAFALFLPGGTPSLAVTRAAHLLDETLRTYRESTRARGGLPWRELDPGD